MPELTTVIPVFNGARFIAATLRSVAAQTRRPDRVVVLDNGSTDGTREAACLVREIQLEWRVNDRNLGMFGNMNRALQWAAETDYLHLLHADDLIRPDFYRRMEGVLEGLPGRGLGYCVSGFIDEAGQPSRLGRRWQTAFEDAQEPVRFLELRAELRPIVCPAVLLKTARQRAPVLFREDLPQLADLVFWAEWVAAVGQVRCVPEKLADYRVHPASATRANAARLQSFVLDEWKAIEQVEGLRARTRPTSSWRWAKLRGIFAARSVDKVWMVRGADPELAAAIRREARRVAGRPAWWAAKFLVGLRVAMSYVRRP